MVLSFGADEWVINKKIYIKIASVILFHGLLGTFLGLKLGISDLYGNIKVVYYANPLYYSKLISSSFNYVTLVYLIPLCGLKVLSDLRIVV